MLKYLLIIWVCVYIYTIVQYIFKLKEIDLLLDVLGKYLSSAQMSSYGFLTLSEGFTEHQNKLLFHYPKITNHLGFYTPDLSYGNSNEKNYSNAVRIYNDLAMHRNYSVEYLKRSFNPMSAFKKIFSLPSTFINWIGFNPNDSFTKFINLIGWFLAYFLNLYSAEIKSLINSFFQ